MEKPNLFDTQDLWHSHRYSNAGKQKRRKKTTKTVTGWQLFFILLSKNTLTVATKSCESKIWNSSSQNNLLTPVEPRKSQPAKQSTISWRRLTQEANHISRISRKCTVIFVRKLSCDLTACRKTYSCLTGNKSKQTRRSEFPSSYK